eukprot:1181704-Amphidinium_carterae.3
MLEQPLDDDAVAAAKQHGQVKDLRRKLLDTEACTFFEWPSFLGEIPPTVEAHMRRGRAYVKDVWARSPKKIYKWIRGNASVWDLAILHENGYALSPDQTAQAELRACSKLWQPGIADFPNKCTSESAWRNGDLRNIISHCRLKQAWQG